MQTPFQAAVNQLCAEKNLDRDVVVDAIEKAIALAYKKDFGTPGLTIKVHIGEDITQMRIFEERVAADQILDHEQDILLKEAMIIRPDVAVGDTVFVPVEVHESFGRIAAQAAKQIITQKLQEAERSMLFDKFKDKIGQLLSAKVQKIDQDTILLDIDGVTTILFAREQIPGEKYFTGQRIKVFLQDVELTSRGPQLRITRRSPQFIVALFEQEIPEMKDGTVYVAKISREAGTRCKIAVASDENGVDPVGAFVGQKGSRISAVMDEVGDERLDVIQHYDDKGRLLLAALSPAKIAKTEFFVGERGEDRVKIHVPDSERAIAIGKRGQNVRLAGMLIDTQVDVITYDGPMPEDIKEERDQPKERKQVSAEVGLDVLKNVDAEAVEILNEIGLSQVKQFEGLKAEELTEVGITLEQAEGILKAIDKYLRS